MAARLPWASAALLSIHDPVGAGLSPRICLKRRRDLFLDTDLFLDLFLDTHMVAVFFEIHACGRVMAALVLDTHLVVL